MLHCMVNPARKQEAVTGVVFGPRALREAQDILSSEASKGKRKTQRQAISVFLPVLLGGPIPVS